MKKLVQIISWGLVSLFFVVPANAENLLLVVLKLPASAKSGAALDVQLKARAQNSQPFSQQLLTQLSIAAQVKLKDVDALALGGRVLQTERELSRSEMNQVLARLNHFACCSQVAYAERSSYSVTEDSFSEPKSDSNQEETPETRQKSWQIPAQQWYLLGNDHYNNDRWFCNQAITSGNSFVVGKVTQENSIPAFIPALAGAGVAIGVLDTGYTANPGLPLSVYVPLKSKATGKSLCESGVNCAYGYDFLTDCRRGGRCPVDTPLNSARLYGKPQPNGLDVGDGNHAYTLNFKGKVKDVAAENSSWHGTAMISQIVAQYQSSTATLIGAAPAAKIIPVRVIGKHVLGVAGPIGLVNGKPYVWREGTIETLINGMLWAAGLYSSQRIDAVPATPAKILSISLGYYDMPTCPRALQEAIEFLNNAGVVVIAAAGNSGMDAATLAPANCNGVITVAATTSQKSLTTYSNYGKLVSIAVAIGEGSQREICSVRLLKCADEIDNINCQPGKPFLDDSNKYIYRSVGTSPAAALTAAAVAQALAIDPSLTPAQIKTLLQSTGTEFASPEARCHPVFESSGQVSYDMTKCVDNSVSILNVQALLAKVRYEALIRQGKFNVPTTPGSNVENVGPANLRNPVLPKIDL